MVKKPFTTRLDEHVLALAQRIAESERRSVTSVIEIALLDYAEKLGIPRDPLPAQTDLRRDEDGPARNL